MDQEEGPNLIQNNVSSRADNNTSLVIHNEADPDEFGGLDPYLS